MKPELKAEGLISKYGYIIKQSTVLHQIRPMAIKCAIICVEEIMPLADGCDFGISGIIAKEEGFIMNKDYWQQVLNHLNQKQ